MSGFPKVESIAMPEKPSTELKKFIDQANKGIQELNDVIEQYNQAEPEDKLKRLYQIYLKQKDIDNHLPQTIKDVTSCPEYREKIHKQLFQNLQKHFKTLGVDSLEADFLEKTMNGKLEERPDRGSFSEILANMSPEKVDTMESIFLERDFSDIKASLLNLYAPQEEGYAQWQEFLNSHSFSRLGGDNSFNIKITPHNGNPFVLKIETRLNQPKNAMDDLSKGVLKDILSPRVAERNGPTRTLYITDFFPEGDLQSQAKKKMDDATRVQNALTIYTQMGTILQDISNQGYAFTDIKNSNWLTEGMAPRIADSKAFFPLDDEGNMVMDDAWSNDWFTLQGSGQNRPPEWGPGRHSAEKAHAYTLGKNLYNYLTGHQHTFKLPPDGTKFNFEATVFATEEGQALKKLIEDLVKSDPAQRISVEEAVTRMKQIKKSMELTSAKKECHEVLHELEKYKYSENIEKLTAFIEEKIKIINEVQDVDVINGIKKELDGALTYLKEDQHTNEAITKLASEKKECHEILEELKKYKYSGNNQELTEFMEKKLKKIDETIDVDEIVGIKKELNETLNHIKNNPNIIEAITKLTSTKKDCQDIFEELKRYKKGDNDQEIDALILEKQTLIENELDVEKVEQIKNELSATLSEIALAAAKNECRDLLDQFKQFYQYKKGYHTQKIDDFIQKNQNSLNKAQNIDDVHMIKKELEDRLPEMELTSVKREAYDVLGRYKESRSGPIPDSVIIKRQDQLNHFKTKEEVQTLLIETEFEVIGNKLKAYQFGKNDEKMSTYIKTKKQEFKDAAGDLDRMKQIKQEFSDALSKMEADPVINGVKEAIDKLKKRNSTQKVQRVEDAMAKIPIDQRGDILKNNALGAEVQQELARRRNVLFGPSLVLTGDGQIDESNAAKAFIKFKMKFKELIPKEEIQHNQNQNIGGMQI
ncbi:Uncharacterised protein [Legionella steigerwaltii]|uniref:Serine/threonine protein kinase n=1 Tax=Legionella steigerwaltii TaxID=460 RepID=A0A378LAE6_9GAMM|nr:hypothetical protein [Legionella steigerwaltii]KTD71631.1 serine/threonine protein kinase [Legionella steigerwaltii]STY23793.1 Uncharacterised protein [Legionella steigerwaltii]